MWVQTALPLSLVPRNPCLMHFKSWPTTSPLLPAWGPVGKQHSSLSCHIAPCQPAQSQRLNANVCELCPDRNRKMSKNKRPFAFKRRQKGKRKSIDFFPGVIVPHGACQWLRLGLLFYPLVWMLSGCASARQDSALWRTAQAAMTATLVWTAQMVSTEAANSCVSSRWRLFQMTPPCTTSSCSAGECCNPSRSLWMDWSFLGPKERASSTLIA